MNKTEANFKPLTPLHFLDRAAAVYPNHIAVIHGERRYDYAELYRRSRKLASALRGRGVERGDTVSIIAPNTPAILEAHYGVPMAGAVLNPINTRLDPDTVAFILEHGEAKVLLTDRELSPTVAKALASVEKKPIVIDIDNPLGSGGDLLGETDYEAFLEEGSSELEWLWPEDEWDAISLNYTSGTTGNPKGVLYHHRGAALLALGNLIAWTMPVHPVYLWTLPMFHCNGWCFPWSLAVNAGTHVSLKWTPFFRPGVKVVKQACSMKKGAEKSEEKSHEAQPCFQGESCLGGTTRAGDSGGTIPAAQGSREPDLQVEAAAFGERRACFRDRRGGRRRCLDARGRTAPENRGADDGARFFITRARSIAMTPRRELVEPNAPLSMRWQCELLGVNRSSLYYEPVEPDGEQLALMRRMDELHLKHPFFGSRMMTQILKAEGSAVNRKRVQRLMRLMGLESTAPKPNTSKPAPEHTVYPYLLRNLTVSRINQVWAADITYIPMARGFVYLVAVIDWYSRRVLAWRLSNTLETTFCVEAVNEAVARYGRPEIFNTDQGSQFTSEEFTSVLLALEIKISMDGKGRCIDNIFVERLWRSLKYEEVYLYAYDSVQMAREGIACYFDFFNDERPHKALGYQTPASFYDGLLGEVA